MMQRQVERLCMEYNLPVHEVQEKWRMWASEPKVPREKAAKVPREKAAKVPREKAAKVPKAEKVMKEKAVKEPREKVPRMPFVGIIHPDLCQGVRKNDGLYSQCENKKKGEHYCVRCEKEGEKNGRGEPNEGNIEKREKAGNEYRSEKGERPVNYMKYMKKKGWSKEEVEREASRQSIVLPDTIWEETKKGRPAKKVEKEKEKEDLFAKLKAESETKELEPEVFQEVEEIKVRKQEYNGKTYLRDSEDRMYDPESEEEVGRWKDGNLELY
jgi:hypothetical protein